MDDLERAANWLTRKNPIVFQCQSFKFFLKILQSFSSSYGREENFFQEIIIFRIMFTKNESFWLGMMYRSVSKTRAAEKTVAGS